MNDCSTTPAFMPPASRSRSLGLFDPPVDGSPPFQSPSVNGSPLISASRPELGFCPSEDDEKEEEYFAPISISDGEDSDDYEETEDVAVDDVDDGDKSYVCVRAEPTNKSSISGADFYHHDHHRQRRFGPTQPNSRCETGLGQPNYRRVPHCQEQEDREDSSPPPGFSLYYVQGTRPSGVGAGLNNLGNTCFLNSILQCFTHTVPLVNALRSCKHAPESCGNGEFCALSALRDHIEVSLASSGTIFAPTKIVDNLKKISSTFQINEQEDAHEFFMALLDKVEACLGLEETDKSSSLQDVNIVKQVFGGRFISKLRCCACGHHSDTYESMLNLSLGIEEADTLQSALDSFSSWEKVEYQEPKRCEGCREETSWEKQLLVDEAPCIATMHLMRFDMNGSKILKSVGFPLELDLQPYTNGSQNSNVELKYQLYAIVEHSGSYSSFGHYSCYIRSSPETWYRMDDSRVIRLQEETVLSRSAYILFYAREGTPWFSTLMEPQKISLDPGISNSSPKSVLDNMDYEGTACTRTRKSDYCEASTTGEASQGILSHISRGRTLEGVHIKESGTVAEGITAGVSNGSSQSEQRSFCYEYTGDTPMIDVSEVPGTSDCGDQNLYNQKPCAAPSEESNGTRFADNSSGSALHSRMLPKSCSPDALSRKLPESNYRIPRDHLKTESRFSCNNSSRKAIRDRDSQKTEAVRSMKTMPAGRRMQLMAAMSPRNEKGKVRSSPYKRASPHRKLLEPMAALR